jgi:hypothetical protein
MDEIPNYVSQEKLIMSTSYEEALYDQYLSERYEELKVEELIREAIKEFTDERLKSYFLDNRAIAKPAVDALSVARELFRINVTASFLFAAIAVEVGLKTTLLKPIVYGLVHAESVASLVTDLAASHAGMDRYRKLLLKLLQQYGGVDLDTFKRSGSNKALWEEIKDIQSTRNLIVHRAETASEKDAELALSVATEILETIFPAVVKKLGL